LQHFIAAKPDFQRISPEVCITDDVFFIFYASIHHLAHKATHMLVQLIITVLAVIILWVLGRTFLRSRTTKANITHKIEPAASPLLSIQDFSGDNRCDTELDLAKAYLELQQYEKTKQLLKSVITHGTAEQILDARKMFSLLLKRERLS
jgi:FimV-like protein